MLDVSSFAASQVCIRPIVYLNVGEAAIFQPRSGLGGKLMCRFLLRGTGVVLRYPCIAGLFGFEVLVRAHETQIPSRVARQTTWSTDLLDCARPVSPSVRLPTHR